MVFTKDTNAPLSMIAVSSFPLSDPEATSALSKSPVDKCVYPYFCTIFSHCVPFPLPGPPVMGKQCSFFNEREIINCFLRCNFVKLVFYTKQICQIGTLYFVKLVLYTKQVLFSSCKIRGKLSSLINLPTIKTMIFPSNTEVSIAENK